MSAWDAHLRAERLSRILETRGLKMRACAFDELLPDPSRLRTRIDDEFKPACLAEDVGGGYIGNMQLRFLLDHERDEITCIADD